MFNASASAKVKADPLLLPRVPALTVSKANVNDGWKESLNRDAPQSILDAVK